MDRPLVGIVSSYNEIVPGHMNLDKIVNAVKRGVAMAGGTPKLYLRQSQSVMELAMGHIGMKYFSCNKRHPSQHPTGYGNGASVRCTCYGSNWAIRTYRLLLMAAARINIPTIFVSGVTDACRTCKRPEEKSFQHVRGCWSECSKAIRN